VLILKEAVFTGANLKNVNFSGTILNNGGIFRKGLDILNLDRAQQKVIKWKR
jgi:uncharacterized protein YjbI with pentapeptide repeats